MKIKLETERKPDGAGNEIMRLTDAARAAVQAALDEVNGKATSFTVCSANKIYDLSLRAESYLMERLVLENDRVGATLTFRPKGPYANAYKSAAISTIVKLTRTGSGWILTGVERSRVYPCNPARFDVTITNRAANNLIRRTLKAFGRALQQAEQQAAA
ncbi:MAG TPA: hypothetical protein VF499_12690 [Afipia sp.]